MLQHFQPPLQTEQRKPVSRCTVWLCLGGQRQRALLTLTTRSLVLLLLLQGWWKTGELPALYSLQVIAMDHSHWHSPTWAIEQRCSVSYLFLILHANSHTQEPGLLYQQSPSAWDLPEFLIFHCLDRICRTGVNQILTTAPPWHLFFVVDDVHLPDWGFNLSYLPGVFGVLLQYCAVG